jgi:hypothetical protein
MANIMGMLSIFLTPGSAERTSPPPPRLPEDFRDRLDHDLVGLSDSDAMWYYEIRKWRGRD